MQEIQHTLRLACHESNRVSFRNDYSGRGMWGKQCVGIVGSKEWCDHVVSATLTGLSASVVNAAIAHGADPDDDRKTKQLADREAALKTALEILPAASRDNMGYDVILYWPSLEPIEQEAAG